MNNAPPYPVPVSIESFAWADECTPTHQLVPLKRWGLEQDVITAAFIAVNNDNLEPLRKAMGKLRKSYATHLPS